FAVFQVVRGQQQSPASTPPVEPARNPFAGRPVAGVGVVEPRSENISLGSALPGLVTGVFVKVGDRVGKGQVLFELDDRQLRAELAARKAALAAAQAQLDRLKTMPRREEVPPLEARQREAKENLIDQEDLLKRSEHLYATNAVGEE